MRPAMNEKAEKRGPKAWCRELAAAWIVGGAIWVAGLGGLATFSAPQADGASTAAGVNSGLNSRRTCEEFKPKLPWNP